MPLSDSFTYLAPAVLGFHRLRPDSVGSFDIDWDRVPQSQYRRRDLYSSQVSSVALTGTIIYTYTPSVPEPSALALVGVGFAGLMGFVWRNGRRRRNA